MALETYEHDMLRCTEEIGVAPRSEAGVSHANRG